MRAVFGRVGGAVSRVAEGVDSKFRPVQHALRRVQQLLVERAFAHAWVEGEKVRELATGEALGVEALVTLGVCAAATGRHEKAVEILQEALTVAEAEESTPESKIVQCAKGVLEHVKTLLEQSQGKGELLCGPLWKAVPPDKVEAPKAWEVWIEQLPKVAEYTGPVKVKWAGDPQSDGEYRGRGLFTTRKVAVGEPLLTAWPLARASSSGAPLVAALRHAMDTSKRARKRLMCLDDGHHKRSLPPPDITDEALQPMHDEPVGEGDADEFGEEPSLEGVISTNVFSMQAEGESAFLYGLPSILNHNCSGNGASALKLVLVFLDGAIIFRAARDLEEGEELCHRYFDVEGPLFARRDLSAQWGFECTCPRCSFEESRLPSTPAGAAVEDATKNWRDSFRLRMNELDNAARLDGTDVSAERRVLRDELLAVIASVESSAAATDGWTEEEVGWCLSHVKPMSNAALFCVIQNAAFDDEVESWKMRCTTLRQITLAWQYTERYGYDHLKTLYMHWQSLCQLQAHCERKENADQQSQKDIPRAMEACEKAFYARFGITAEDLSLGRSHAAKELLRRLES